jgi:hypothetical protein
MNYLFEIHFFVELILLKNYLYFEILLFAAQLVVPNCRCFVILVFGEKNCFCFVILVFVALPDWKYWFCFANNLL